MLVFQFKSAEISKELRNSEYTQQRNIQAFGKIVNASKIIPDEKKKEMNDSFAKDPTLENARRLLEPYGLYQNFLSELQTQEAAQRLAELVPSRVTDMNAYTAFTEAPKKDILREKEKAIKIGNQVYRKAM